MKRNFNFLVLCIFILSFGFSKPQEVYVKPVVKLASFSCKKESDKVKISWQTTYELNTNFFIIEKSPTDSIDFTEIGYIRCTGNSFLTKKDYTYTTNYEDSILYRLKYYNYNGNYSCSDSISLK